MTTKELDAEALYQDLLKGVKGLCQDSTRLVGITSGGAWLAQRLQADMGLEGPAGIISSVMHRDDFAQRGLSGGGQTSLPFDVNGADILFHKKVFDARRFARVQNSLEVNRARSHFGKLALGGFGHVFEVYQRKTTWILFEQLNGIFARKSYPVQVKLHFYQLGIGFFEQHVVGHLPV